MVIQPYIVYEIQSKSNGEYKGLMSINCHIMVRVRKELLLSWTAQPYILCLKPDIYRKPGSIMSQI